jgi:hypothetical protein
MHFLMASFTILGSGAAGGLIKGFLPGKGGIRMPSYNKKTKVWDPGLAGNILVGGVAPVIIWLIYGPFSGKDFATILDEIVPISLLQIGMSFLIGIGGATILSSLADKQANELTKESLAEALKDFLKEK